LCLKPKRGPFFGPPLKTVTMNFLERKEKLDYLLEMIEKERLISLKQAAEKFECSKRTIKRMISDLRNMGYDITYCKRRKRFYKN